MLAMPTDSFLTVQDTDGPRPRSEHPGQKPSASPALSSHASRWSSPEEYTYVIGRMQQPEMSPELAETAIAGLWHEKASQAVFTVTLEIRIVRYLTMIDAPRGQLKAVRMDAVC